MVTHKKTNFNNAKLTEVTAHGASFSKSQFKNTNFNGADLTQADMSYSTIYGANFMNTKLSHAIFDNSMFIVKSDFSNAVFIDTKLDGVKFDGCVFNDADFTNSSLKDVDFGYSYLQFTNADLSGAIW